MNRLQKSIVRFLKYVIELENLIILLNIGSLSFLSFSFIADRSLVLSFAMQEREWRPLYNSKPLNREEKSEIKSVIIIIFYQ